MHVASALTGSRTAAALVIALALSSTGFAGDAYYNEIARDGRIYVFAAAGAAEAFQTRGELGSHAVTRPGYGPGKETVVFDSDDAVKLYNARHGLPEEPPAKPVAAAGAPDSPLQLHLGSAAITPLGFMDMMGVWRSHTVGSGIGTNFAAIPYGDTYQTNLSEFRFSMQNSRIGFRVDADVKSSHAIGYMEADFLGNAPGNVAVSTNSNTLRSRLYWIDLRMGRLEVLGGQTWSLVLPGRSGISPLPGNLFFTQVIDPNYQLGLYWGRIPELRLVYHASTKTALAVALGGPEQYIGGSAGGPVVTLPAALASTYSAELDNGTNNLSVPNRGPDVIAKLALDPSRRVHFEVGGVLRMFQLYNPTDSTHHSATGGGGFGSVHVELLKGFRVLANGFLSSGGGRYVFGQAPDLIARADGSPSLVKSNSTVVGFEYTHTSTLFYGYYGGLWVDKNVATDTDGKPIGYGYDGSPSSHNRLVQEITFGVSQTFWKDPKYGALNLMGQYSYLERKPWFVAAGAAADASLGEVLFNLRYTLPGSAPAVK
jgi:hypothetical protein